MKKVSLLTLLFFSIVSYAQNTILGDNSLKSLGEFITHSTTSTTNDVNCMKNIGNYLYIGYWGNSNIDVYDVSDPSNQVWVNTQSIEATNVAMTDMIEHNGMLMVVSRASPDIGKFYIVDVSDPLNLNVLSSTPIAPINANIVADGNYVYISTSDASQLKVMDISDPTNPVETASFTFTGSNNICAKKNQYVYNMVINGNDRSIEILDVSDPTNPTLSNSIVFPSFSLIWMMKVIDNYLYVSYFVSGNSFIRVYDLTNPTSPIFNEVQTPTFVKAIEYDGFHLYASCEVSNEKGSLTIFDASSMMEPVIIAQSDLSSMPATRYLFQASGYVYIINRSITASRIRKFEIGCSSEQLVSIDNTIICPNSNANVYVGSTENDFLYYLRDNENDTIVAGPVAGDGNPIDFNTGDINGSMSYNVLVENYNNALSFDGVNDHILLPNESAFDFTTEMTVEFSLKTTDLAILDGLVTKGDHSWRVHGGPGGVVMFAGNGAFSDFSGSTSVDDGLWHHVAVTYNGVEAKIYVDGVLENNFVTNTPINNTIHPVAIGENSEATGRFFHGDMDEVRIWNVARSSAEINATMSVELDGTEPGLIAYYNFNQGTVGNDNSLVLGLKDLTSNNYNGVFNGFALNGTSSNFVKGAPSFSCENELGQIVSVTAIDDIPPTPDFFSLPDVNEVCEVTSLTPPTATDNCSSIITVTHNATLPITAQGITDVIWTYTDENGNTTAQIQSVILQDNTAPTPDLATLPDVTGVCEVTTLTAPTATDNCSSSVAVTHDATLPITAQGTTEVTWTYDDGNGNTTTQTQNIVLLDNIAPMPDLATLPDVTGVCEVTTLTPPTATDNCGSSIIVTHNVLLPITALGTTEVTWTYDDGNGNTTTQTQNVIVEAIDITTSNSDATISAINTNADSYQWINCSDNSVITGETSSSYTATATGEYAVIITTDNCSDTSDCVAITIANIESSLANDAELLEVYPNPNNGTFTVSSNQIGSQVQILSLDGRVLQSFEMNTNKKEITLDAAAGVYLLNISNENQQQMKRVVVR